MLLSSQDDNYDDPTASSTRSEPPAGDNSSSRWSMVGALRPLTGFVKNGIDRLNDSTQIWGNDERRNNSTQIWGNNERRNDNTQIWRDNERRNDNYRPPSGRSSGWDIRTPRYHLSKDDLRNIALSTLQILEEGEYFPPGQDGSYDLRMKIRWTDENTRYYGPDAGKNGEILESEFIKINERGGDEGAEEELEERDRGGNTSAGEESNDASSPKPKPRKNQSEKAATTALGDSPIYIGEYSTLVGARKVHFGLAANADPSDSRKIGVLNFASAKKPGGGFINGSQAQEESIARSSTLYPSLITHTASPFYSHYPQDPNNAYYTHAMVYSPAVVLLRDDDGEWRSPVEVDVLTSAAVNAGEIRRKLEMEERERREIVKAEIWKRMGEERRKENEKAAAERRKLMEQRQKLMEERRKKGKLRKKKEGDFAKSQKEMVKSGDGKKTDEGKTTHKGKAKNSDGEKETSVEPEKTDTEVEKGKGSEAKGERPEVNREENATDSPERGSNSDEENKESKESLVQDENATDSPESGSSFDRPLKELEENKRSLVQDDYQALPEVSQQPTFSSIFVRSQIQPSQGYLLAVSDADMLINQTMYARISRILHLFQLHQTPHIILGSFGTGVFQNRTDQIARIFADLLVKPDGRFKNVFKTVVFAILGKETVRVFTQVFSKVDRQAQKERRCKTCVFMDEVGGDGDVREREHERNIRLRQWNARRNALWNAAQDAADAAAAQDDFPPPFDYDFDESDAVRSPPSFQAAEASAAPYPTQADAAVYSPFNDPRASAVPHAASFTAAHADAAAYPASSDTEDFYYISSSDVPQASAATRAASWGAPSYPSYDVAQPRAASYSPSFHHRAVPHATTIADNQVYLVDARAKSYSPSFHHRAVPYAPTFADNLADARAKADIFSVQGNPTADDDYGILDDEKMVLTGSNEQVNLVAEQADNTRTTRKTVDEGRDVEMMESKSVSARPREARDGDIEMK